MKGKTFGMSMLDYCKVILEKISFNPRLFRKEYRKTFRYLAREEHDELKVWLRNRFKEGVLTSP